MTPREGYATWLNLFKVGFVPEHGSLVILGAQGVYYTIKHVLLQTPVF